MGRPKGSKNKPKGELVAESAGAVPAPKRAATGKKVGRPREAHPKETWGWVAVGHEVYALVKELLTSHFARELTVADARPLMRDGGKPVTWGCKLGSVPSYLKSLQVEGHTDRVLLIDKAWWEKAGAQERKGRVHAVLARAAKERPVELSALALRAHGLYVGELRDLAEVGARQLTLELDEARAAFGVGIETAAGGSEPQAEVNSGRGPGDAVERAKEIEESQRPSAPEPEPHVPEPTAVVVPEGEAEDLDEEGALKPLAQRMEERMEERERSRSAEPDADEEPPGLEDAIAEAVGGGAGDGGLTLLDGETGDPVEEDAGVNEFAAVV